MPIYLPPINRRRFLAGAAALLAQPLAALGAAEPDPDSLALMADTHIAADRSMIFKDVNMADHLAAVVKEVIARPRRPAVGIVVGDLAKKDGQPGDYAAFVDLLKPLREAGLPLHLTLGNHDQRDRFAAAVSPPSMTAGKLTEVLELPRANLFILDTLDKTDAVAGELGSAQLAWLEKALDARPNKPAVIIGHHDPILEPPPKGKKPGGLLDTASFLKVLEPRKQVKAYVYGHTHTWDVKRHESGIHLVNLPPTSYLFFPGPPSGWVDAVLRPDGMRLELRSLDVKHATHGQVVDLKWRS
jgi:Icc protein